jgi:hypothetical protein
MNKMADTVIKNMDQR